MFAKQEIVNSLTEDDINIKDWKIEPLDFDVEIPIIEFEEDLYIKDNSLQSKAGKSSYKDYKPLKAKAEEICKNELNKKKYHSALQLCNKVAEIIESKYQHLLKDFMPYKSYKKENTDWTKPTFYNWCNEVYKVHKTKKIAQKYK